jgi:ribosome-associated protein
MEEFERPSKSALKRQMTALQKLGEALVELSDKELARIPIDDDQLIRVIREARAINSRSARRRHLQYLGKLMRSVDPEPLQRALDELHQERRGGADAFQHLEQWRDRLLAEGDAALEDLLSDFPGAERQQLRQLIRQHQREAAAGKPPAASRKLFRYLRDLAGTGKT